MIHIQQRALSALQQHPLAPEHRPVDQQPGVGGQRQQARGQPLESGRVLVERGSLRRAHHLQEAVGPVHPVGEERPGALEVAQIGDPDPAAAVLVLVRRADPPPRRAELLALLARGVEELVIREHQVSAVGDEDPPRRWRCPAAASWSSSPKNGLRLEHHAVADDADDPGVEDAGGDLPQDELACSPMTTVCPALAPP